MPNRYLVANWKMNLPAEGVGGFIEAVAAAPGSTPMVIAPPFPYIREVADASRGRIAIGAQNCADQDKGAFTGEVSARMVYECGARFVIVGHSERRHIYGETDTVV